MRWRQIAVEEYAVPACLIERHEHPEIFLHVVLSGSVMYEVSTRGRLKRLEAVPGTTFILPRGTVDEVRWEGPTRRLAVAIGPYLLEGSTDETMSRGDIELVEHWALVDPQIASILQAMRTDLSEGSPAGRLYGESLANALAVYLVGRYGVRRAPPRTPVGGMPGRRLRRVLDYIGENLTGDLGLADLAGVAGMSPHYFSELFRRSMGRPPHQYVLSQRIERAKKSLRNPKHSVLEAGLSAGFDNPSHFARTFRRLVGATPRQFRAG
ncbi:MAG TPA: AraC family transcriptional regulator [Thermoanaerobaculia bacterium]